PREVSRTYGNILRNTDNSCREKSADAIVVRIRAIYRYRGLTKYEGPNLGRCAVNESYQMKEGMQKIFDRSKTCPQKNRTEPEGYVGGQTFMWITETDAINNENQKGYSLLEMILSPTNLNKAYLSVKRNKGAGGVDRMEVDELGNYLKQHKDRLINAILNGK